MYDRLHEVGITTRGACADSVRNVTACPHTGLLADEPFDVGPYAQLVNDYFLFNPLNLTLPRKFKISFTNCERDCAQGAINDIGFYAHVRTEGGRRQEGFAIVAAGGLGSQPFLAARVRDFVPVDEILIVAEGLVRLQHRAGERKNRSRARMKYLMRKLGADGFTKALDQEIARVEATRGAALRQETREYIASFTTAAPRRPPAPAAAGAAAGYDAWCGTNVVAQREAGHFLVTITIPIGDYTTAQGRAIAELARDHGNGTLRLSNEQNILVPYVSGTSLPAIHACLVEIGLAEGGANHITDVVSCPGADYCSLAVTRSMGMAERIRQHLTTANLSAEAIGEFHVKISGCPNSCGQHHVGDIGLTGMMIKGKDGKERPHYSILVGGQRRRARREHRKAPRRPLSRERHATRHRRRRRVLPGRAPAGRGVCRLREARRTRPTEPGRGRGGSRRSPIARDGARRSRRRRRLRALLSRHDRLLESWEPQRFGAQSEGTRVSVRRP